jgi:hypothetical protein
MLTHFGAHDLEPSVATPAAMTGTACMFGQRAGGSMRHGIDQHLSHGMRRHVGDLVDGRRPPAMGAPQFFPKLIDLLVVLGTIQPSGDIQGITELGLGRIVSGGTKPLDQPAPTRPPSLASG